MGNGRREMTIGELVNESHGNAKQKGFHDPPPCDYGGCWEPSQGVWVLKRDALVKRVNVCTKLICQQSFAMAGYSYTGRAATRPIPEALLLIVTEVAEAMEDYRNAGKYAAQGFSYMDLVYENDGNLTDDPDVLDANGDVVGMRKPVGFPSEVADVVIRIGDLCGQEGIDLQRAINEKMRYNATRKHKHGKTC